MDSESQNQEGSEQPRQPRNLQDTLRYAIEAGTVSDVPQSGQGITRLEPERRRFLEDAINSLTVDVVRILTEAVETLKGLTKDTLAPETYENALDVIADHVDNLDAANDYVKLGGFTIIDNCLQSRHPGIRWRIADIIAQCTQNNPFCQNHALNLKLLEPLILMVDKDPDELCKTKAFFAISNIVRDSIVGLREFMRLNGFAAVKKALKSDTERLRDKAAFFFSSVLSHHPNAIWDVVSMGFPELLISLLQKDLSVGHEFVAASLLLLAQQNQEALSVCKKPDLRLEETLERIIEEHEKDEPYIELIGSARELRKLIAGN